MKIAITGSTGLVGSALVKAFKQEGHTVYPLVRERKGASKNAILWSVALGLQHPEELEGMDVVIHLAGESVAERWSESKKQKIRTSRVLGTEQLCRALIALQRPPKLLINASAIGYYGETGDHLVNEEDPPGEAFLSKVAVEWEKAADIAKSAGIRVVKLRTGIVLSPNGGALSQMLTPFRLGLGGVVGSGNQWMSWIALDDMVGIVQHIMSDQTLHGPVNAVTPNPVTNREFTKTLGKVLKRPTLFPLPAFVAKLLFGEMADELLLCSTRVNPTALSMTGYSFLYPDLEGALRHLIAKNTAR